MLTGPQKKLRGYRTTNDVWNKVCALARKKGAIVMSSECLDNLVIQKYDEVFSRTQK